jgi:hypothetical protein
MTKVGEAAAVREPAIALDAADKQCMKAGDNPTLIQRNLDIRIRGQIRLLE